MLVVLGSLDWGQQLGGQDSRHDHTLFEAVVSRGLVSILLAELTHLAPSTQSGRPPKELASALLVDMVDMVTVSILTLIPAGRNWTHGHRLCNCCLRYNSVRRAPSYASV